MNKLIKASAEFRSYMDNLVDMVNSKESSLPPRVNVAVREMAKPGLYHVVWDDGEENLIWIHEEECFYPVECIASKEAEGRREIDISAGGKLTESNWLVLLLTSRHRIVSLKPEDLVQFVGWNLKSGKFDEILRGL